MPISSLSNINKIIEKLMDERLYESLSKHKCICDQQFRFRSRHSTNHALLDLTDDIGNAKDDNEFAVGVFVYLQKAFDTADHNVLLKKLDHYGIRRVANNWFKLIHILMFSLFFCDYIINGRCVVMRMMRG